LPSIRELVEHVLVLAENIPLPFVFPAGKRRRKEEGKERKGRKKKKSLRI
jgi:hypothetical protein